MKKRIAVLVSGGGSNLQSLIDRIELGDINAEIACVISNRKNAYALQRALDHGIPSVYIGKGNFPNEPERQSQLKTYIDQSNVDYIVLAGYLSILPSYIINAYPNRIINIHPSLIPQYCGVGFYGEKIHVAVLKNKESLTGATVHYVDEGVDTGKIIVQEKVRVLSEDTVESLSKRVLAVEHKILSDTVRRLCQ